MALRNPKHTTDSGVRIVRKDEVAQLQQNSQALTGKIQTLVSKLEECAWLMAEIKMHHQKLQREMEAYLAVDSGEEVAAPAPVEKPERVAAVDAGSR